MIRHPRIEQSIQAIKSGFLSGIESVQPGILLAKTLRKEGTDLVVGDERYQLRKTYVVGFGKAVAGMFPVVADVLKVPYGSYLKRGIFSVPFGFRNSQMYTDMKNDAVEFYEGAELNLPDEYAHTTAKKIVSLVKDVRKDELLIVLISGGGSSLLPLPNFPLSLEEKTQIISDLSKAGASIVELNIVRKSISATKGGKLALLTNANIITFILSDIIGSPLDMIASGPTVKNSDTFERPVEVLQKYGIPIKNSLKYALENRSKEEINAAAFSHVNNILIGDNNTALEATKDSLKGILECNPIILTNSLAGDATLIGRSLARLCFSILEATDTGINSLDIDIHLESFISTESLELLKISFCNRQKTFCLLFGGETTVKVVGTGKGGRNQEMILAASLEFEQLSKTRKLSGNIVLLSGGTDGIDGPTDAAGAITWYQCQKGNVSSQVIESRSEGLDPEKYLLNNDSYEYFSQLNNGDYLLKTGHTGTNVMDIQIIWINVE